MRKNRLVNGFIKKAASTVVAVSLILGSSDYVRMENGNVHISDSTAYAAEVIDEYGLKDDVQDGVILHAFDWSFNNITKNMKRIACSGYTAIQTSVIQPSKQKTAGRLNYDWWVLYQPIAFRIDNSGNSGLGTKAEFTKMCAEAHKYGIKIIVDVVANHLANNYSYDKSPAISSSIRNNNDYWHNHWNEEINDYNDRYRVINYSMGGIPDLNTENADVQKMVIDYLKECIDAGADGFRFDAAKHIGTPADGSRYTFWPNVVTAAKSYYASKGYYRNTAQLYVYGEILDNTSGDHDKIINSYKEYMSVTDNGTSNSIRNAVVDHNSDSASRYWYKKGLEAKHLVLWAESHDTYSNKGKESTNVSTSNINKTWAIVAAKADATSLYFARTDGYRGGYIGEIYSTQCFSKEVVEVNKFHNYFDGTSEYMSHDGDIVYNERGHAGVVLVNCNGTSKSVNVKSHVMADGSYVDHITGNIFTVSGGRIKGNIGTTGIAVVYAAGAGAKKEYVENVKSFTVKSVGNALVSLKWNKVSNATGYEVSVYKNKKWSRAKVVTTNAVTFKSLVAGQRYKFRIRAYVSNSGVKSFSDYVYTYGRVKPSAVKKAKVMSSKGKFILTWKKTACNGYEISYYKNGKSKNAIKKYIGGMNKQKFTSKKLVKGVTYVVKIRAVSTNNGVKSYSKAVTKKIKIK